MRAIISLALPLISFTASSGYTTMTIEGVKQANGVWTTAGVADSMGFVRTTGALTVAGESVSTSVALRASQSLSSQLLKTSARSLGPYGIAALGAYEVYDYFDTDTNLNPCTADPDSGWCYPANMTGYDSSYTYKTYWSACSGNCSAGSTKSEACQKWNAANGNAYLIGEITSNQCMLKFKSNGQSAGYLQVIPSSCGTSQTPLSCVQPEDPNRPQAIPMSQSDWDNLPMFDWSTLNDGFQKIPALKDNGLPLESTSFSPFSQWMGDPYFKDGNWWRDRMDISPAPTANEPTRVRVDVGPVKLPGQTNPNIKPDDTPASGNTQPKEQTKFCDDNPQSIACVQMGELEPEELDSTELPISLNTPAWGSDNSQCPAPVTGHDHMGKTFTISFQPTCDFLEILRPIIIACAWLAAIYILLGIRKQGEGES